MTDGPEERTQEIMEEKDIIEEKKNDTFGMPEVPKAPEVSREMIETVSYAKTETETQDPDPVPKPNLLVFGILSLALGYSYGLPGIILGIIGRSRGNKYLKAGGTITGKDRAGYIMSKAGLIVGIVNTALVIVIVALYICFLSAIIAGIAINHGQINIPEFWKF